MLFVPLFDSLYHTANDHLSKIFVRISKHRDSFTCEEPLSQAPKHFRFKFSQIQTPSQSPYRSRCRFMLQQSTLTLHTPDELPVLRSYVTITVAEPKQTLGLCFNNAGQISTSTLNAPGQLPVLISEPVLLFTRPSWETPQVE